MTQTCSPRRVLLSMLCAALAFFAVPLWDVDSALAQMGNPHGVAVIIGNRNYTGAGDVKYAHRDAEAFRRYVLDVLGFDPDNVIHLKNASQAQMVGLFGNPQDPKGKLWFYLDPDEGRKISDVVVYYSGHGMPGLDEKAPGAFLLPTDANPNNPRLNGYSVDVLYKNLGKLPARSVRVFLDACFTGQAGDGRAILKASPVMRVAALPASVAKNMTVLTAARKNQLAYWDEKSRHGMFTHHLLDALYGKGDTDKDGKVTAHEAQRYLRRYMRRAVRRLYQRDQLAQLIDGTGKDAAILSAAFSGGFPERPSLDGGTGVGKKDETKTEEVAKVVKPAVAEKEVVLDREKRKLVQRGLASLGLYKGFVDGAFGPKTSGAIRSWQKAKGYGETGKLTKGQADALVAQGDEAEKKAARERVAREKEEAGRRAREAAERERSVREAREREKAERERALLMPGRAFRDCPECPEMVVVPAGSYLMGSPHDEEKRQKNEGPRHRVTIAKPFAAGKYEVTRREFGAFVSATGRDIDGGCWYWNIEEKKAKRDIARSWRSPGYEQTDLDPVVCVNWDDARAYVAWLSNKTDKEYRLPSEGEWEYAARGGTRTSRYWGDDASAECTHANGADGTLKAHYSDWPWVVASCRDGFVHTAPAGSFSANGFGLHDVLGNVWEWVEDCWNERYVGAPSDGSAWTNGNCGRRVLRGGSWYDIPWFLRSAFRFGNWSGYRYINGGFRVARTLDP